MVKCVFFFSVKIKKTIQMHDIANESISTFNLFRFKNILIIDTVSLFNTKNKN